MAENGGQDHGPLHQFEISPLFGGTDIVPAGESAGHALSFYTFTNSSLAMLVGVAAAYNLLGVMVLSITEMSNGQVHVGLEDIVFEQVSAFATVGLSTGLTPALSTAGKLWIVLTMFVGRLGPLTIALVMMDRRPASVRMPEERLMIG